MTPIPTITPASLIAQAVIKYKGAPGGASALRPIVPAFAEMLTIEANNSRQTAATLAFTLVVSRCNDLERTQRVGAFVLVRYSARFGGYGQRDTLEAVPLTSPVTEKRTGLPVSSARTGTTAMVNVTEPDAFLKRPVPPVI